MLDNPETISWLVVFDTWIRNADRYAPEDLAPQNAHEDNVFLTGEGATQGRLRLLAIDHTECFTSTATELSTRIAAIDNIKDPRVYGLFPQFRRFLDGTQLHAAAERLRTVDAQTISNILRGVPREWDLAPTAHLALARFIEERARFVAGPDMVDKLMSFRVPSQSLLC
ncbi:hypothetical protein FJZ36_16670 [Candidatus Poribacteria bacterium]|nr:hypothetical protein [Candidatus Poribacteria bacterium]